MKFKIFPAKGKVWYTSKLNIAAMRLWTVKYDKISLFPRNRILRGGEGGEGEKGLNRNFVAVLGWGGGGSLKLGIISLGNRVQGLCIVMKSYRRGTEKAKGCKISCKIHIKAKKTAEKMI
jgi:hypothetical protein